MLRPCTSHASATGPMGTTRSLFLFRARAEFAYLARIALDGEALLLADQSNALVRRIDLR